MSAKGRRSLCGLWQGSLPDFLFGRIQLWKRNELKMLHQDVPIAAAIRYWEVPMEYITPTTRTLCSTSAADILPATHTSGCIPGRRFLWGRWQTGNLGLCAMRLIEISISYIRRDWWVERMRTIPRRILLQAGNWGKSKSSEFPGKQKTSKLSWRASIKRKMFGISIFGDQKTCYKINESGT